MASIEMNEYHVYAMKQLEHLRETDPEKYWEACRKLWELFKPNGELKRGSK